jgi:acetyltransferase
LLAAYDIPTVPTTVATSSAEALAAAEGMGYPVVLKLHSFTITHKTDVGGVKLDLHDGEDVRRAFAQIREAVPPADFQGVTVQPMVKREGYELIVGSSIDPQFGPVLLFGSGGTLVEVYKDRALGLPPLTSTLALQMIDQTVIARALAGMGGQRPVDREALAQLLVTFSELVVEQPAIKEIDINPLLASADRLVALDARVVLHPPEIPDQDLPRPAIRPYPRQYISRLTTRDGLGLTLRPIRPEDEPAIARFHETLSERTVYLRYLEHLRLNLRVAHQRLARICFIDYARDMALVAERDDDRVIAAVARLARLGPTKAEFALLVADAYQGQGLGTELLRRLVEIGRAEGLKQIVAEISAANGAMQAVARRLGFRLVDEPGAAVDAIIDL